MEETILDEGPKRPPFLQVLCILTFIGVGFMLLLSLLGAKSALVAPTVEDLLQQEQGMMMLAEMAGENGDQLVLSMLEAENHKTTNWILGFLGNILTLIGVILMWQTKKIGFFIYILAEIVPAALSLFFGGASAMTALLAIIGLSGINPMSFLAIIFSIDIIFIILYGLNLKHMK